MTFSAVTAKSTDAGSRPDQQDRRFPPVGEPDGGHLEEPGRQTSAQHQPHHPGAAAARQDQGAVCAAACKSARRDRGGMGGDCCGDRALLYFWHPALYVLAVMVIGSRQHALLILGHDASHYRYLPTRWQNDLFANLFLMWPTFASVEGFRKFHGTHHQYTNLPNDGNRHIWYTHDAAGELEPGLGVSQDAARLGAGAVAPRRCSSPGCSGSSAAWWARSSFRRRAGCVAAQARVLLGQSPGP